MMMFSLFFFLLLLLQFLSVETPDWRGAEWCYVEDVKCSASALSSTPGSTREWMRCDTTRTCADCPPNSQIMNQIGPVNNACACNEDYYADITGTTMSCVKCQTRSTSLSSSTSINDCTCNEGTYLNTISAGYECLSCPINSIMINKIGPVNHACACSEDYYAEITGTTMSCVKCQTRSTSLNGATSINECTCIEGTYLNTSYTGYECLSCPINSIMINKIGPINHACVCSEDYYAEITGTTMTCVKCPSRSTSLNSSIHKYDCKCQELTFLHNDACNSCPLKSKIMNQIGPINHACACNENYYSTLSTVSNELVMTCTLCDDDKTAQPGSDSCICKKELYYQNETKDSNGNAVCIKCPDGADCSIKDGILLPETTARPGYWRPNPTTDIFSPCEAGYSSLDAQELAEDRCCPINKNTNTSICSNTTFIHTNEQCKKEYAGTLCLVCADGYVKQGTTCIECPPGASIGLASLPLIGVLLCLFLILLIFLKFKKATSKATTANNWFGQAKIMLVSSIVSFFVIHETQGTDIFFSCFLVLKSLFFKYFLHYQVYWTVCHGLNYFYNSHYH
jgi:hypothetical protein